MILPTLVILSLASCGNSAAAITSGPSSTTTTLVQQGQLVYGAPFLPTNFNPNTPAGNNYVTREVMARVWPSAFYLNSQYRPVLDSTFLDSAELVSTAPQTIVYQINPHAIWSDGVPISATDFIYNWRAQEGNSARVDVGGAPFLVNSNLGYSSIKSITGSNNGKTVTVIFRRAFSEWESLFSPLVPAHIGERVGWNSGFVSGSSALEVSGGPYQLASFVSGKEISLIRNPNYWGRKALIPRLIFENDPNPELYSNQFENGTINLVQTPAHDLLYSSISYVVGVKTYLVPSLVTQELIFNLSNSYLSDVKVRRAIALALDRKTIVYDAIGSYQPKAVPVGNHLFPQGVPQYQNNGTQYLTSNPQAAIALLLSDGYYRSSSGAMMKNGFPLTISISVDSSSLQQLLVEELISEELAGVGITVQSDNRSATELYGSVLPKGSFDMAIISETGSPYAALSAEQYLSHGQGGGLNYSHYSSSVANSLIAQATSQLDPGQSAELYNQLDKVLWKDLPSIPLYSVPNILAYSHGYEMIGGNSSNSTIFWNSDRWSYSAPS